MQPSDPRRDPRPVDELINVALSEPDEDIAWNAVCALHWRGTEDVLGRATALCRSACPLERRLGADILGQLGVPERTFPEQCVSVLLEMLDSETEAEVLVAIFVALSFLHDTKAIPAALRFAAHPDPDVRQAVVLALTGHEDPRTIELLIRLTADSDADVRDWATFGLGTQSELNTREIRDALATRLNDPDYVTRGEALVGLARRGDSRVVAAIETELSSDYIDFLVLEAAELAGVPELSPPLQALRGRSDIDADLLKRAIAACTRSSCSNAH